MFRKILINSVLSLLLIALVALVLGSIRYDQVYWYHYIEKDEKVEEETDYLWLTSIDRDKLVKETEQLIDLLERKKQNLELIKQDIDKLSYECNLSLKGLLGKVDPLTQYKKDLRRPPGFKKEQHYQYYDSVQELRTILNEIETVLSNNKAIKPQEKVAFVKRLKDETYKQKDIRWSDIQWRK